MTLIDQFEEECAAYSTEFSTLTKETCNKEQDQSDTRFRIVKQLNINWTNKHKQHIKETQDRLDR